MTITANPWIFAILFFGIGCFGVWLIWLMRRPRVVPPDPYEAEHKPPPAKTFVLCDFIETKETAE